MNQTRPGDELVATISPDLDVVLDAAGCIVLCTRDNRVTIPDAGKLGQALLSARLIAEARDQDWWGQREADMTHRKIARALELGQRDARNGVRRDMDDDGSAWLMDQLGETEPTTEANHLRRAVMCDAYTDAYRGAAGEVIDVIHVTPSPEMRAAVLAAAGIPDELHDGHISCTPEGCVLR